METQCRQYPTIQLSLSTSSPTVSLQASDLSDPFYLIVRARQLSSPRPSEPITTLCLRNPLDNHPESFFGLYDFSCLTNSSKKLVDDRAFTVRPHFRDDFPPNLRDDDNLIFRTIPPVGQGEIEVKHFVSRERMREKARAQPGEKYRVRLHMPYYARMFWWVYGDLETDLKGKKFYDGISDVEHDGWVESEPEPPDEDDGDEEAGVKWGFDEDAREVVFEVVD